MFRGLPSSSRVWAPENGGWTLADHLLAANVEWTHANWRMTYASIPTKDRKQMPEPLVIKRPGQKPEPKKSWIREWAQRAWGR